MPDWTQSMQQTFEYYIVDPSTWSDVSKLENVKNCTIIRDKESDTLGSAELELSDTIGECYIRVYLITLQNGVREKFSLGTCLVQTTPTGFDGKSQTTSADAYTPLIELKENPPPIGYTIKKGEEIMRSAYLICNEHMRAPIIESSNTSKLSRNFISNTDDTWLSFVRDLISLAKYELKLDDMGEVLYSPIKDITTLNPKVTFDDGNSSILLPSVSINHDLYGIPNVVEISCVSGKNIYNSRVVNKDPNSPISTVNRGREIIHRPSNISLTGTPTKEEVDEYANNLLKQLSTVEYTVSYSHGYYPVNIGDCIMLNYTRAGIHNQKAQIISQRIQCKAGCQVSETARYTNSLWG